jgi:tryptophan 6-halogenase
MIARVKFVIRAGGRVARRARRCGRACSNNGNLSDSLKELYGLWLSGRGFAAEVGQQGLPGIFLVLLHVRHGVLPPQLRPPSASESHCNLSEIDIFVRRSALNFRDHREALSGIPPKIAEESLQVYFW